LIGSKESIKFITITAETPLPAGRQGDRREGTVFHLSREVPGTNESLLLLEYLISGQPDPRWFFLS
jgi:hypothetical protein